MPSITPYPDTDDLLRDLLQRMQGILRDRLLGLYLYGSLVTGGFDPGVSDADLLAVIGSTLTEEEAAELHAMHDAIAAEYTAWDDRIEVTYVPAQALKTFRTEESTIGAISPGEPFNVKSAGREWLMNWWMVRERGVALHGPPPSAYIDPITRQEFLENVREHTLLWMAWLEEERTLPPQAYVILTACRAMYAVEYGEQVSKKRAARWARGRYPEWSGIIDRALGWREGVDLATVDPEATYAETVRFATFAIDRIMAAPSDA
jgi:hypothetical protein